MARVTKGLYVRLEAKPGKEQAVEAFLHDGLPVVQAESGTTAWFAIRMGPSTFGIFDVFADETGRQAHLNGDVAKALGEKASELFSEPPAIAELDVLGSKLPKTEADEGRVAGEMIPMQVGAELRISNKGELVISNAELELSRSTDAADATLSYRFDRGRGEHVLRLVDPVADHRHMRVHRQDD